MALESPYLGRFPTALEGTNVISQLHLTTPGKMKTLINKTLLAMHAGNTVLDHVSGRRINA